MFETELDNKERASLASIVSLPGFKIVQKLFEMELEKFYTKWLNLPPDNADAIVSYYTLAKSANQIYVGTMNRISAEVELYTKAPKASDKPFDPTENLLDLGGDNGTESESRFNDWDDRG